MPTNRRIVTAALVATLLATACGGGSTTPEANPATPEVATDDAPGDELATSTTTTTTSTTTTSTTPPTTTTAAVAVEVSAEDLAMAAAWDAQAVLVEAAAVAGTGSDPLGELATMWLDFRDANAVIDTGPAAALAADYVTLSDAWLAAIDAASVGLAAPDAGERTAAFDAFNLEIEALTRQGIAADGALADATLSQLEARSDAAALYLAGLLRFLAESQPVLEDVLIGFNSVVSASPADAEPALAAMFDSLDIIFTNVEGLRALEPTAATSALHDEHERFWDLYAESFRSISDAFRVGEDPPTADVLRLVDAAAVGPELYAERSRTIAAAFRGELD
jgi:hypothetical protein